MTFFITLNTKGVLGITTALDTTYTVLKQKTVVTYFLCVPPKKVEALRFVCS